MSIYKLESEANDVQKQVRKALYAAREAVELLDAANNEACKLPQGIHGRQHAINRALALAEEAQRHYDVDNEPTQGSEKLIECVKLLKAICE